MLPSVLVSLGLTKKPNFKDWQDEGMHRVHWALLVLQHTGFESISNYDFDHYICGPFSQGLEDALEAMNWRTVVTAHEIDDARLHLVREAILKGDDFLLALSLAVGIAERNPGASKGEVAWAIPVLIPDLANVAEAACDFAEERIWSK